jgi:hypothetical protein
LQVNNLILLSLYGWKIQKEEYKNRSNTRGTRSQVSRKNKAELESVVSGYDQECTMILNLKCPKSLKTLADGFAKSLLKCNNMNKKKTTSASSDKKNLLPLSEKMSQSLFEIAAYCLVFATSVLTVCVAIAALLNRL